VAQGAISRTVCYDYSGNTCWMSNGVNVQQCNGFFVYKLITAVPGCSLRLCTSNVAPAALAPAAAPPPPPRNLLLLLFCAAAGPRAARAFQSYGACCYLDGSCASGYSLGSPSLLSASALTGKVSASCRIYAVAAARGLLLLLLLLLSLPAQARGNQEMHAAPSSVPRLNATAHRTLLQYNGLYHGWTSPIAGCSTSSWNVNEPTVMGGYYPYNAGDTLACRAWKVAATVCNTQPTAYGDSTNWQCPTAGGFSDPTFGSYCYLGSTQYSCSTCPGACNAGCAYIPLSLRNCNYQETQQPPPTPPPPSPPSPPSPSPPPPRPPLPPSVRACCVHMLVAL
jgi:hypothetical protein